MQRGYLLKQGSKALPVCGHVIGFENAKLARKVQYSMHPEPRPSLIRGTTIDVTSEVAFGLAIPPASVRIDVTATVLIPKAPAGMNAALADGGFHMHEVPFADLIAMPFELNVGLVMARGVLDEDADQMSLDCYVIEPGGDFARFAARLEKGL